MSKVLHRWNYGETGSEAGNAMVHSKLLKHKGTGSEAGHRERAGH
jgi:hypothetical protein